ATGVRRDFIGRDIQGDQALASALDEAAVTLPPPMGATDVGMLLVFGLVALVLGRSIVRDADSFHGLVPEAPTSPDVLDDAKKAALAGADAKGIPTLDGMRGIAVILVLMFHFAWTFPGDDPEKATGLIDRIAVQAHAFMWSGWIGVDLFFVLSGYLITRGL